MAGQLQRVLGLADRMLRHLLELVQLLRES